MDTAQNTPPPPTATAQDSRQGRDAPEENWITSIEQPVKVIKQLHAPLTSSTPISSTRLSQNWSKV